MSGSNSLSLHPGAVPGPNEQGGSVVATVARLPTSTNFAQYQALILSAAAFTVCFAVWTLFSIVGIKIKQELSLNDSEFGLLVATPVLTGALSRLFLGLLSDKFGGRRVFALLMLLTAGAVYSVSVVSSFPMFLVAALGLGFSGGSFAVGVSYVSNWFDRAHQGTALGIFGAGTIGTAVTTFGAPLLVNAFGWRETVQIYAAVLAVAAIIFYLLTREDPASAARSAGTTKPRKLADQLAPLARLQVWRFSLYYFFVFGAFVALASWLPRYYMGMYGLPLAKAGLLTTALCPAGGGVSRPGRLDIRPDRRAHGDVSHLHRGQHRLLRLVLSGNRLCRARHQGSDHVLVRDRIAGLCHADGRARLLHGDRYGRRLQAHPRLLSRSCRRGGRPCRRHRRPWRLLPADRVRLMNDLIGVWTSCFMLLFGLVTLALAWMHGAIRLMERGKIGALKSLPELPEMAELHKTDGVAASRGAAQ